MVVTNAIVISNYYSWYYPVDRYAIKSDPQPLTLEVEAVGYSAYSPNKYSFNWTNLVCTTQFQPIVTKSNDVWVIRFNPVEKLEKDRK